MLHEKPQAGILLEMDLTFCTESYYNTIYYYYNSFVLVYMFITQMHWKQMCQIELPHDHPCVVPAVT